MPAYDDIYIISERREKSLTFKFLDKFLPHREESSDEYFFPQYADNSDYKFDNANDLIDKCLEIKGAQYGIYWRSSNKSKPEHAMVFFLPDDHIVFGLSTNADSPDFSKKLLSQMKGFFNTDLGYIAHEAFPDASNISEFRGLIKLWNQGI